MQETESAVPILGAISHFETLLSLTRMTSGVWFPDLLDECLGELRQSKDAGTLRRIGVRLRDKGSLWGSSRAFELSARLESGGLREVNSTLDGMWDYALLGSLSCVQRVTSCCPRVSRIQRFSSHTSGAAAICHWMIGRPDIGLGLVNPLAQGGLSESESPPAEEPLFYTAILRLLSHQIDEGEMILRALIPVSTNPSITEGCRWFLGGPLPFRAPPDDPFLSRLFPVAWARYLITEREVDVLPDHIWIQGVGHLLQGERKQGAMVLQRSGLSERAIGGMTEWLGN